MHVLTIYFHVLNIVSFFILPVSFCYNLDGRNVDVVSSAQIDDYFGYSLILKEDGRFVKQSFEY